MSRKMAIATAPTAKRVIAARRLVAKVGIMLVLLLDYVKAVLIYAPNRQLAQANKRRQIYYY